MPGPDGLPGPSGAPGDKTAIVPTHAGFVGLVCTEMPEARFEDLIEVSNPERETFLVLPLDRIYLETIAPGTATVAAIVSDTPCPVGAKVVDGMLYLDMMALPGAKIPSKIAVRLSGLRKGSTARFRRYTEEQARANTAFWDAWKKDIGR
jgi:hypothetical protein